MENKVIIYQTSDGQTQLDVRLEKETVWLTQAQMAELFQTDRTSIVRHINNIYKSEELDPKSTCAKIAQVQNLHIWVISLTRTTNRKNHNLPIILLNSHFINYHFIKSSQYINPKFHIGMILPEPNKA